MYLVHNIRDEKPTSNYNTLEEVLACPGPISFDGVYLNVFENKEAWKCDKELVFFITGDYVGKGNEFDVGQPYEPFCDWSELLILHDPPKRMLGWHTWSHRDLTKLSDEELKKEVTPPDGWGDICGGLFAYPYGRFDDRVVQAVKDAGFLLAYGVSDGTNPDDPFRLPRQYL